jgi:2Fe-2S ferredoxin
MPLLTILPAGKTIEAVEGPTILEALLGFGEKVPEPCGDEAKCGTCHIFVHDGRKTVSKMQRLENERLDEIVGVGSKSRLACQTRLGNENVTIELLGFGSGL